MTILDESQAANLSLTALRAGVQASIAQINANGGLGGSGHPIQTTFCSTGLNQAGADTCTHQAASDSSIVAVVGSISGEDISTALNAAGLPEVDAEPLNATAWSSPNSFPNNAGALIVAGGGALAVNDLNAQNISMLYIGLPQAQATVGLMNAVLASWKHAPVTHAISVPVGASDVSSYVTAAAQGSNALIYAGTPSQMQQVVTAAHELGLTTPVLTSPSYWTADALKSNASILEGYNSFNYYPTNDVSLPGNTEYLATMSAQGAQASAANEQTKAAWVSLDMFNTAAKGMTDFTRASLMSALNSVSGFDAGGLVGSISFASPGPLAPFPRLHSVNYFWSKIQSGQFVAGPNGKLQPIYGS
jgi:ABC-type branched-subunit amino acid transport system substrate-binding protein